MVFDVTIVIVLGPHEPCLCRMVNLINFVVTPLQSNYSPISLPILGPPYSLRHIHMEIGPTNHCTMRVAHRSL